jgi:glutamate racemase
MPDARPIGLFDSGVGGLTVLREVLRRLPDESTIYLGDNARAPYGPREDDEVIRYSSECLDHLARQDVKAIVVACNTASAVALPELRRRARVPVLGVVRPGATAAALATRSGRVGVIATQATVRSHAYLAAILDEDPTVMVHEHATPELVPLVESGHTSGPDVLAVVRRSLQALLPAEGHTSDEPDGGGVDTLLLGCTHYPLLVDVIASVVGPSVAVIDSASATASWLAGLLEVHGIAAPSGSVATHVQLTTGDVDAFRRTAAGLFGEELANVQGIALPEHPIASGVIAVAVAG